jgi:hypothetical protein
MTPLFACFPMCMTFVALGIMGVVVVEFGLSNPIPGDDQPAPTDEPSPYGITGPPPWWVIALMLLALALLMLVLGWYWPE